MASVKVHNGEYFERGKTWYIVFSVTLIALIVVSVLFENFFGAIILFLLVGGYILFALMRNKQISIHTTDQGLVVGEKVLPRTQLTGRSLEADALNGERKNLIIATKNDKLIFTFDDTKEHAKAFVEAISATIPLIDNLPFSFTEKLIRKLKL